MSTDLSRYVVIHNVVHLRAKPTGDSELVSQTLMGRILTGLREENGWLWTEGDDTYRGWADRRWLAGALDYPLTSITKVFASLRVAARPDAPLLMRLPILAAVYRTGETETASDESEWERVMLPDGARYGWIRTASFDPWLPAIPQENIGEYAAASGREFLGTPYLWGGSSTFGLDCSGFVQLCYRLAGINLRRDADVQRNDPRFVPVPHAELLPGDLVFFGRNDRITHVGMHLIDTTFIHSAGGAGVILTEWGDDRYSPSYVDARRLDPAHAADPITRFEAENR